MPVTPDSLPTYRALMLPVLRAVAALGGSASNREIIDKVIETEGYTDQQLAITYPARDDEPVLTDRLFWALSYCKLGGALESPKRKLYLITPLGRDIAALDDAAASDRLLELDRQVRTSRKPRPKKAPDTPAEIVGVINVIEDDDSPVLVDDPEAIAEHAWTETLLHRLHQLSPQGFEEFSLYLLRLYGLTLTRRGGPGDEGIDGIGIAPLSDVLSVTVAVQVKRYEPSKTIGRETVALLQQDARTAGAERAILVTLARFSAPAQKAAASATPHVDLIDGSRLCELVLAKVVGVTLAPIVDVGWFDRFEH